MKRFFEVEAEASAVGIPKAEWLSKRKKVKKENTVLVDSGAIQKAFLDVSRIAKFYNELLSKMKQ